MTKIKQLELPKKYNYIEGISDPRYKHLDGVPKLSYSAINSFSEDGYRGEFFQTYFLGQRSEGNIFTAFGSKIGEVLEKGVDESKELSEFDVETVLKHVPRPDNAVYEAEIVLERDGYCIQGFIDKQVEINPKVLTIEDLKTGSIKSKKEYYAGEKYQQTTLYAHQRAIEGYDISYSGVILLDRKGNGQEKYPLRLTGDAEFIPTPYSPERAEKFLKECDEVSLEIQEYFRIYNKYLK